MAQIRGGATTDLLSVDPTCKAARVSIHPRELNGGGIYTARMTTGVLPAALAVNAPIFGLRQAGAPVRSAYILRIQGAFSWVIAATAAQQFGFYMERFSAANLAGGAAAAVFPLDTAYPASEMQDVRVSTTAALTSSGVTFAGGGIPMMGWTNPAIGAGIGDMPTLWDHTEGGPIKLTGGQGLCIRNLVVWPAAGTGVFTGRITWEER